MTDPSPPAPPIADIGEAIELPLRDAIEKRLNLARESLRDYGHQYDGRLVWKAVIREMEEVLKAAPLGTFNCPICGLNTTHYHNHTAPLAREAKLVEALRPFADCCDQIDERESDEEWAKFRLLVSDYRRARQAIANLEGEK